MVAAVASEEGMGVAGGAAADAAAVDVDVDMDVGVMNPRKSITQVPLQC
jgi:hypothetical protein